MSTTKESLLEARVAELEGLLGPQRAEAEERTRAIEAARATLAREEAAARARDREAAERRGLMDGATEYRAQTKHAVGEARRKALADYERAMAAVRDLERSFAAAAAAANDRHGEWYSAARAAETAAARVNAAREDLARLQGNEAPARRRGTR